MEAMACLPLKLHFYCIPIILCDSDNSVLNNSDIFAIDFCSCRMYRGFQDIYVICSEMSLMFFAVDWGNLCTFPLEVSGEK